ncbi:hypothetical protein [Mucilaginibacter paludis]|nr:hypothetical protein [Mucilaginibacter paludis]
MKTKTLLSIGICFLSLCLSLPSCKVEQIKPIQVDPVDGGGGGGGGTPSPPPYVEPTEITNLRTYFANTAGVSVSQVYYDSNSDIFGRSGTTDVLSHAELANYYYYYNLNNAN